MKRLLLVVLAVTALSARSNAQNLLTNGSFESGLTGWTLFGTAESRTDEGSTDGTHSAVFNYGNVFPAGTLIQSFATTPGTGYILSFDYGAFGVPSPQGLYLFVEDSSHFLVIDNFAPTGTVPTTFQTYTKKFFAFETTTYLKFNDLTSNANGFNADTILDNVSVVQSTATPEASSLALSGAVGVGCGAFGLIRRLRRR